MKSYMGKMFGLDFNKDALQEISEAAMMRAISIRKYAVNEEHALDDARKLENMANAIQEVISYRFSPEG